MRTKVCSDLTSYGATGFWFSCLFWIFLIYPVRAVVCAAKVVFGPWRPAGLRLFMTFQSALWQNLAGVTIQGFHCKKVEDENWLVAELTVECPQNKLLSPLFLWTLVTTLIFPIGIPIVIYLVLRWEKVPQMAKEKREDAIFLQLTQLYSRVTSMSLSSKVRASFDCDHRNHNPEAHKVTEMFQQFGSTEGTITIHGFRSFLKHQGVSVEEHEQELNDLFSVHGVTVPGALTSEEFQVR
jgi:hypothetical protein